VLGMQGMQPHPLGNFLEAKFGKFWLNLGKIWITLGKIKNHASPKTSPTAIIETYSYHFQWIFSVDA